MLDTQDQPLDVADGRVKEWTHAIEALIFAADEPVTTSQIAEVIAEVTQEDALSSEQIEVLIGQLNSDYEATGRVLSIQNWAGGFRMATKPEVAPYLKAFFSIDRQRKLSRSLMETLAILTYRQPATKPEVDFVRGVDSDYALRKLMEIGLADVIGRSESVGRPLLYGTTPRFLEAFGLARLDDLPNLREIEALLDDPAFNREKARLLMLEGLDAPEFASEEAEDQTDEENFD
ncbi:MAG TPA: SMC-Scp complex subunit ScpB [Rhodothermales bacterium]|nr:SMC-Scp complex subunit ScpB [Rhodothermales bacterium]